MRKALAIALILLLCLSLVTTAVAVPLQENPFIDVQPNDWFFDAVQHVSESGLMHGTTETTFTPRGTMSRAMAVTVLHRLAGRPSIPQDIMPLPGPTFLDVQPGRWYSDAVFWANYRGIATGVGSGRFAPHDSVTREQFAVMLYRFAAPDYWVSTQLTFSDAGDVSPWAQDALRWAVNADILRGANGRLNPQGAISRAECAAMLLRFSHYLALEREPAPMSFGVRPVRTNGLHVFPGYPIVIRSMDDLSVHMEFYSRDFFGNRTYLDDVLFGMYTEEFFKEHFLVILYFVEGSGSNRHRVETVLDNGDIHVTRIVPDWGTQDRAYWHIILEVDSNIIPKQINLTVTTEERMPE